MRSNSCVRPWFGAALSVCFLTAGARADELQYLPDNPFAFMTTDAVTFVKSQAYAELKRKVPRFEQSAIPNVASSVGVPLDNIARMSSGVAETAEKRTGNVAMVATLRPITFAEVKANLASAKYKKNVTFTEFKVGRHTVYEEQFQFQDDLFQDGKPGEPIKGDCLCIVSDKFMIRGRREVITRVLERNKQPEMTPTFQEALKLANLKDALTIILDFQAMPARDRDGLKKGLPLPGVADVMDAVESVAIRAQLGEEKLSASATVMCKDAASAADLRRVADGGIVVLKGVMKENPKMPKEVADLMKEARGVLDSVKLSSNGKQAIAELSSNQATLASFILLGVQLSEAGGPVPAPKNEIQEKFEKK